MESVKHFGSESLATFIGGGTAGDDTCELTENVSESDDLWANSKHGLCNSDCTFKQLDEDL